MWTAIKSFFGGLGVMFYVYLAVAAAFGLLYWRNSVLAGERDAALITVGEQTVVIKQLQQNVDYAKLTVEKWKTAQEMFQSAVVELNRVTYLASEEGRKLNVAFASLDAPLLAATDPGRLERNRNAGWGRLNCLLSTSLAERGRCPAGPTAAGEEAGPAPAR